MTVVETSKRPSAITLISILGIYAGLVSFYWVFQEGMRGLGLGTAVFLVLGGIVFLSCGIGFWFMKKWAVYVYAVFGIINQIVLLLMGRWTMMALLIPAIVVYVGHKHFSKMS